MENDQEKQLQQAFMMYLAKASGAKDEKELQQFVQQLGEDGLKKAYSQFLQEMQKGGGQETAPQIARKGAKLEYIKRLRGVCKEDEEPMYYKVGGTICKKCQKKKQVKDPGALPITPIAGKGTKVVKDFKSDMKKKISN